MARAVLRMSRADEASALRLLLGSATPLLCNAWKNSREYVQSLVVSLQNCSTAVISSFSRAARLAFLSFFAAGFFFIPAFFLAGAFFAPGPEVALPFVAGLVRAFFAMA